MRKAVVLLAMIVVSCSDRFEADVEKSVRQTLKDPESLIISDVEYFPDQKLACGKYNAKNSFGGYVGKENFTYRDGSIHTSGDPDTTGFLQDIHECLVQHVEILKKANPGVKFDDPGPFVPPKKLPVS